MLKNKGNAVCARGEHMAIKIKLLDGSESILDSESRAPSDALRDLIQNTLETDRTAYLVDKALLLKRMSRVLANKGLDWEEREQYEKEFNRLADELTESTAFSYMGREGLVDVNPPDYSSEVRRSREQLLRDSELSSADYRRMSSEIHREQEGADRNSLYRRESPGWRRNTEPRSSEEVSPTARSRRRNNDEPEGPEF